MSMKAEEITRYLHEAFPGAEIELVDLAGDDNHWQVSVTSSAFKGKSRVAQHQMVYAAMQGKVDSGELHALAVKTIIKE